MYVYLFVLKENNKFTLNIKKHQNNLFKQKEINRNDSFLHMLR